ncbi:hypothetical protein AB0E57_13230, partial [Micrococcus luteus]
VDGRVCALRVLSHACHPPMTGAAGRACDDARPRPSGARLYGVDDGDRFARSATNQLRTTAARYPDDPEIERLIGELLAGSNRFAELWQAHDVAAEPTLCKTFEHPQAGLITVNCDMLAIPDRDQQLILYTAPPGSPSEEALRLLSVIGTQRLAH